MIKAAGRDLIFGGHLIIVFQYLYTSIIMPKIILGKIKMEISEVVESQVSYQNTEVSGRDQSEYQIQNLVLLKRNWKIALFAVGFSLFSSITVMNFVYVNKNWDNKNSQKANYFVQAIMNLTLFAIFSFSIYRLVRVIRQSELT